MEAGRDAFLGVAMALPAPSSSCSFVGSAATSSGGPRMLSFSSSNGCAGLGLSSGASNMQGVLSRVRGPFTPTQWMELEHQALIYKHFAVNAPVPSSLLLPIKRSFNPWGTFGSSSLGWAQFRPGCSDAEPGRCRRTDGKKWRCSRDAVGDQRYCERHINRGRYRSRKHVEGQKATPTNAGQAMAVSTTSNTVAWQQQLKCSAANATNPFPRESNRNFPPFPDKHNNVQDHLSVYTSMDSSDFSITRCLPSHEKVALSAVETQHGYDQTYNVHEAAVSADKSNMLQESQSLVFRETFDDGPLGEVFRSKTCQPAYADILTEEWDANCKSHSLTGIPQMTGNFSSVPSNKTAPVDNHTSSDSYRTRMVEYQTVPTLF